MSITSSQPCVSIIIATYNRASSIYHTLTALEEQTYPTELFEVIVINDGSLDNTEAIATVSRPFKLHYLYQSNQGGTQAKNNGAAIAAGELLIFLDDDIRVVPDFISTITKVHSDNASVIVVGNLIDVPVETVSVFAQLAATHLEEQTQRHPIEEVSFDKCLGGFFSVRRKDFFELKMLEGVGSGWPNWEDVIFGFKAYKAGFITLKAQKAIGYHYDYTLSDLPTLSNRWYRASRVAPQMFARWPGIEAHLPMFYDKTPTVWGQDPPILILRKLARQIVSAHLMLKAMEKIAHSVEQHYPSPVLLRPLYRWINGGYIYRGYQEGLRELDSTVRI